MWNRFNAVGLLSRKRLLNKLSYYIIENNIREDVWVYVRAFDSLKDAKKFKKDHMRIIKVTVLEEEIE